MLLDHEPFDDGELREPGYPPGIDVAVGVGGFDEGGENGLP